MRGLFCALAIALAPGVAAAQDAPSLIAAARAEGVFEPASATAGAVAVRHTPSGLVCSFGAGDASRLIVFPQAARGEDVACETQAGGVSIRLFATRFSFATSLQEQIEGAAGVIERLYPGAQAFRAPQAINDAGLPAHRTVAYLVAREGAQSLTSASVAQVGDWVFKLRYTAPAGDAEAARAAANAADRLFAETLRQIVESRGAHNPPRP
jgi:hypothetical protein